MSIPWFSAPWTHPASPPILPEIRLYLATPSSPWWRSTPEALQDQGVAEPFWAFAWPAGQALARVLLDHPELVRDRHVYDLGAGSGLVAIAAALGGAARVTAADSDPLATEAITRNARLNRVSVDALTEDPLAGPAPPRPGIQVLTAADVTYEARLAERAVPWLERACRAGTAVWLADARRGHLALSRPPIHTGYAPSDVDHDGRYRQPVDLYHLPPASEPNRSTPGQSGDRGAPLTTRRGSPDGSPSGSTP